MADLFLRIIPKEQRMHPLNVNLFEMRQPSRMVARYVVGVFTLFLIVAQAYAKIAPATREQIKSLLTQMAKDSALPQIVPGSFHIDITDETGSIGSVETIDSETAAGGVIQTEDTAISFLPDGSRVESIEVEYQVRVPPVTIQPKSEIPQVALSFAKRQFPQFWQLTGEVRLHAETEPHNKMGIQQFSWRRVERGLDIAGLFVGVRVWDGKVVNASYWAAPEMMSQLAHTKIPPEIATQKFLQHAQQCCGSQVMGIQLRSLKLRPFGQPTNLSYVAQLTAQDRRTQAVTTTTDVLNAITGEYLSPTLQFTSSDEGSRVTSLTVEDHWPTWTPQGLMFIGRRTLKDMPHWAVFPDQAYIKDANEQIFYLTADSGRAVKSLASHPTTSRILMQKAGGWVYSLDLLTSAMDIHGTATRNSFEGDVSWQGDSVAVNASRTGWEESRIVLDTVKATNPRLVYQERISELPSDQIQPVFSQDGKWIYYVQQNKPSSDATRASFSIYQAQSHILPSQNQPPQKIVDILSPVMRMTLFPDGKRLLVWHLDSLEIVDLLTKTRIPISSKQMLDPDLPKGQPLQTRDFAAGPANNEMTFSGYRSSSQNQPGWYIYACNLDGTNLRRLTPLESSPVPMYKFPKSNKTALDIAKQVAVDEIEFARTTHINNLDFHHQ